MSLSKILKGTHSRDMGRELFWSPSGFSGLGISAISALLLIFGIFSWRMQEVTKSQNQDLRAVQKWSINSEKMESSPEDVPGFRPGGQQQAEGTNKLLWLKGFRDTVTLRC